MTANEAIKIATIRAPVITVGATAWRIGNIEFARICQVIHSVDRFGKLSIYARCVDKSRNDCTVDVPIDGVELSPNTPETLRKMIYQKNEEVINDGN